MWVLNYIFLILAYKRTKTELPSISIPIDYSNEYNFEYDGNHSGMAMMLNGGIKREKHEIADKSESYLVKRDGIQTQAGTQVNYDNGLWKNANSRFNPYNELYKKSNSPYEGNPRDRSLIYSPGPSGVNSEKQLDPSNRPIQPSDYRYVNPSFNSAMKQNQYIYNPNRLNQQNFYQNNVRRRLPLGQIQRTWYPSQQRVPPLSPSSNVDIENSSQNQNRFLNNTMRYGPFQTPDYTPAKPEWSPNRSQQWWQPVASGNQSWRFNRPNPPIQRPYIIPIPNTPQRAPLRFEQPVVWKPPSPIWNGSCGFGGKATYYTEWNSNPGSCGYIPKQDNIVAVARQLMPASCGRCILIRYRGKELKAVVTDTCEACSSNPRWIDLSNTLFERFDSTSLGVLQVDWDFCEC